MDEIAAKAFIDGILKDINAEKPHSIVPEAQAMELLDRWRRGTEVSTLVPGDLAVEKAGIGYLPKDSLVIIWRLLDMNHAQDKAIIQDWHRTRVSERVDCMIGAITTDPPGRTIVFQPHTLAHLEKWTGSTE